MVLSCGATEVPAAQPLQGFDPDLTGKISTEF